MRIRLRETGDVMYDDEFRRLHADTSFPVVLSAELLDAFGADLVLEGSQPELAANQYSQYDGVIEVNGQWFTHYIAVNYTPEQIEQQLEAWRQNASCTPFQGRMALVNAGLLAQVQAIVDAGNEETRLAWEYALVWNRTSPMVESLGAALGLTPVQIDDLIKAAQQIVV